MWRRVAARFLWMGAVVTLAAAPISTLAAAGEPVDLELVLLVDASRSIDDGE